MNQTDTFLVSSLAEQHRVQAFQQRLLDLSHDAQVIKHSQNEGHVNQAERIG